MLDTLHWRFSQHLVLTFLLLEFAWLERYITKFDNALAEAAVFLRHGGTRYLGRSICGTLPLFQPGS
jgi:hypothetical protein